MRSEFKERDLFGNLFYVIWSLSMNICVNIIMENVSMLMFVLVLSNDVQEIFDIVLCILF